MFGGQACFYVEPTWKEPVNEPPLLIRVDPDMNTLQFDSDPERLTVLARDPEGENLAFFWQLPPFVEGDVLTSPSDGLYLSRLDLYWSPELEGQTITLTIVDDDPEAPAVTNVRWRVEAP